MGAGKLNSSIEIFKTGSSWRLSVCLCSRGGSLVRDFVNVRACVRT